MHSFTHSLTNSLLHAHTHSCPHRPVVALCFARGVGGGCRRGAYGRVFVAFNQHTRRSMAVKEILENTKTTARAQEWDLTHHLRHENIVHVYGMQKHTGRFYLFMEYVTGGTLKQMLMDSDTLPIGLTRSFTAGLVRGLAYLHDKGIAHRDLKPSNILLTKSNVVKICDFGQSVEVGSITQEDGAYFGTTPYESPEFGHLEAVQQHACKIDVWQLGIVLLDMTGTPPYKRQIDNCFAIKALFDKGELRPNTPNNGDAAMSDFLRQCHSIDPVERASARTLLDHIFISNVQS